MLLAANDMGDAHLDVVDHVGEQEHRRPVAAQQDEVLEVLVLERHGAADHVVDHRHSLGNTEAQHSTRAWFELTVTRVAVVPRLAASPRPLLDLLRSQVAVVGEVALEEALGSGDVGSGVGALEVRPFERRVIGGDSDPGKRVDDPLGPLRMVARFVGVLDAQHERATLLLRQRPVVQGGAGSADVEDPRR